jgi:DNA-binding phage protein
MSNRSNDEAMAELYRQNPNLAIDVINDILKDPDGDQGELLVVLRQVAKANSNPKSEREEP